VAFLFWLIYAALGCLVSWAILTFVVAMPWSWAAGGTFLAFHSPVTALALWACCLSSKARTSVRPIAIVGTLVAASLAVWYVVIQLPKIMGG